MKSWQECCDKFSARPDRGLTPEQVKDNLAKHGHNGKFVIVACQKNKYMLMGVGQIWVKMCELI